MPYFLKSERVRNTFTN
ncbi:hypothetical protein [Paenibacillus woosongensis]